MTHSPLLSLQNLSVSFASSRRHVLAVHHVSLTLDKGEALGLVGESGCGKSTLVLAIMGLLDRHAATISGSIIYEGNQLVEKTGKVVASLRGKRIAMIFQDPMTSLNPYLTIGRQLTEQIRRHLGVDKTQATSKAIASLASVGLTDGAALLRRHPHEFSGGMRQRVMIAMALSCEPDLLIADEPTTALDVTIQAQILSLIRQQMHQRKMTLLMITHDLGVVAGTCDRLAIMYGGQIIEEAPTEALLQSPRHPYAWSLLQALPRTGGQRLVAIPGKPPEVLQPPSSCLFAPRCQWSTVACNQTAPEWSQAGSEKHRFRCMVAPEFTTVSGVSS